ncbi:MAG: hypothetical protein LBQ88_16500 [Treponema sp.]|nr:hypothetical protein [Treponema sp.]
MKGLFCKIPVILFAAFFFGSCGIEDYYYLYPVSSANINMQLNSRADIHLPNYGTEYYYFTHFAIYYRIYISDISLPGGIQYSQNVLQNINPALWSDYSSLEPYTREDLITTINIDTLLKNRHYYTLNLRNKDDTAVDIDRVLNARGKTITLDFSPPSTPELRIDSNEYHLYRSNGDGMFAPLPQNRRFLNTDDLNKSENATSLVNADVANKNISGPRYTYTSMYIVAIGRNNNFSPIYSIPILIGIFQLP